jgi:hypothetical protein
MIWRRLWKTILQKSIAATCDKFSSAEWYLYLYEDSTKSLKQAPVAAPSIRPWCRRDDGDNHNEGDNTPRDFLMFSLVVPFADVAVHEHRTR